MTINIDTHPYDARTLDDFRLGYTRAFITYHAQKFDWTIEFTEHVTRDAIRFLALSALPAAGMEESTEAQVMVSSPIVDKIVDAIFLDTPLLIWLERSVFDLTSRLLHVPHYAHGETNPIISNLRYEFTIRMMRAAGYDVDEEIWPPRLPIDYATCHCGNDLDDCMVMPYRET
jgi:hypothetical protein